MGLRTVTELGLAVEVTSDEEKSSVVEEAVRSVRSVCEEECVCVRGVCVRVGDVCVIHVYEVVLPRCINTSCEDIART